MSAPHSGPRRSPSRGRRAAQASAVPATVTPVTSLTVLTVCTGNVCRSPAAELWLREALGPEAVSGVRVASAGVRAMVGHGVCPDVASLVEFTGVSVAEFCARQLTTAMVREADLVLALSRGHRTAIMDVTPSAQPRTFTLREFARLADGVPPGALEVALGGPVAASSATPAQRLAALISLLGEDRRPAPRHEEDDDVVDPIGQPTPIVEQAADHIWSAVQTIARAAHAPGR